MQRLDWIHASSLLPCLEDLCLFEGDGLHMAQDGA